MYDVAALGEILIDFTFQGENEQGQKLFAQNPGGAPANVLAAMAKMGAKTAFIGKAGNDMHGRFLKNTLKDCGIDESGMILSDDYFTTLAFVDIKSDGEREFSFARKHGADKMLTKEEVCEDIIKNSKILHIGSVSLTEGPAKEATVFAVKRMKELGGIVSYDPNYRASLWESEEKAKEEARKLIQYADLIKISDEETLLMTGEQGYEKAAELLIEQGVKIVVVTLGKGGAYVRTAEGGKIVEGFKVNAVDATGAGDSFWGGFLYCFTKSGKKPEEVSVEEAGEFAYFANATASLCVENYGAIPAMPSLEQIEERMKK